MRHQLFRVVVFREDITRLAHYFQSRLLQRLLVISLRLRNVTRGIRRFIGAYLDSVGILLPETLFSALKQIQLRFCDYRIRVSVCKVSALFLDKFRRIPSKHISDYRHGIGRRFKQRSQQISDIYHHSAEERIAETAYYGYLQWAVVRSKARHRSPKSFHYRTEAAEQSQSAALPLAKSVYGFVGSIVF